MLDTKTLKIKTSKLSFVIPCRNESKYIAETIIAILNQKYIENDLEIIIVDGLSDDGTREIVSKLIQIDPRIVLIDNEKKITPVALNIGVKHSTGEYVFILGAHSSISEDFVFNCLQIFRNNSEVSCAGGPITSVGNTSLGKAIAIAMSSSIGVGNAKHRFPKYEGFAEMACFPVFKKEVFSQIGYFDEDLVRNQDDDFCFRLRLNGGKVYISAKASSTYYVREDLIKLFAQYYQYGYWRIALLEKHKMQIAFRQQIPFLFFILVLALIILGIVFKSIVIGLGLPIIYIVILVGFSIMYLLIEKKNFVFLLPIVVSIIHFSYALGFISGFYNLLKSKKKSKFSKQI